MQPKSWMLQHMEMVLEQDWYSTHTDFVHWLAPFDKVCYLWLSGVNKFCDA